MYQSFINFLELAEITEILFYLGKTQLCTFKQQLVLNIRVRYGICIVLLNIFVLPISEYERECKQM